MENYNFYCLFLHQVNIIQFIYQLILKNYRDLNFYFTMSFDHLNLQLNCYEFIVMIIIYFNQNQVIHLIYSNHHHNYLDID